jgi:hypothetical protein
MLLRHCARCHCEMETERAAKKYCSGRCRMAAFRERKNPRPRTAAVKPPSKPIDYRATREPLPAHLFDVEALIG